AELGEHDRLIVLLDVIEDDHAAARTLATKELRDVLHRSVAFDEEGRPVRVVVDADDVRRDAFPAVVSDHRPRRIEGPPKVIERLHAVPLSGAVGKIRDAPALVERHPSDDARVARVTLESLHPLSREPPDGLARVAIGARHLLPDDEPDVIRPVEIARVLDLL